MPATAEDICNLALGHLGEAPIADIDDDNTRARACLKHYDPTLEAVLRSHRWNFAQRRFATAAQWQIFEDYEEGLNGEFVVIQPAHGYSTGDSIRIKGISTNNGVWVITKLTDDSYGLNGSVYSSTQGSGSSVQVPAFGWGYRFTQPADCLRVLEVNDSEAGDNRNPWIIEGDFILTDQEECRLVYLAKVTDVTKFDPLFVDAFALSLAIRLTESIRGATAKTEQLTAQYERITAPLARRVDSNEARRRKPLKPMNSLAIQARLRNHVAS
jgi:hypothetical protein